MADPHSLFKIMVKRGVLGYRFEVTSLGDGPKNLDDAKLWTKREVLAIESRWITMGIGSALGVLIALALALSSARHPILGLVLLIGGLVLITAAVLTYARVVRTDVMAIEETIPGE